MTTHTADDFPDRISSWNDLANLVEHFSYFNGHDWLFRGVTDSSYELKSKIGRETTRRSKAVPKTEKQMRVPYREEDEIAVFSMFKQQARPHIATAPLSDVEWLSIAQHYGLPTRLLDWTDNLLVAAWFAVEPAGEKRVDSAIWITRGIPTIDEDEHDVPLELSEPRSYRPPHISPRIATQGSVFLVCPNPTKTLVLPFVRKIAIGCEVQFTIKKRLNACGINRRHLFPDLTGLSEHLTWMYKHDWLAGYRRLAGTAATEMADDAEDESA